MHKFRLLYIIYSFFCLFFPLWNNFEKFHVAICQWENLAVDRYKCIAITASPLCMSMVWLCIHPVIIYCHYLIHEIAGHEIKWVSSHCYATTAQNIEKRSKSFQLSLYNFLWLLDSTIWNLICLSNIANFQLSSWREGQQWTPRNSLGSRVLQ